MQRRPAPLVFAFLLAGSWIAPLPAVDPVSLLTSVVSPHKLIIPHMPREYLVSVTLGGDIAAELRETLEPLNIGRPRFEEAMDADGSFYLNCTAEDLSAGTREILSGILNPVEMIDLVIASVTRYRSPDAFDRLIKETNLQVGSDTLDAYPVWKVTATPRGERFGYFYEDMGSYIQESWLTRLIVVIDQTRRIVYRLEQEKHSRRFTMMQREKPPVERFHAVYRFHYTPYDSLLLPESLELSVNDNPTLRLGARYRRENQKVVFDNRSICHYREAGTSSCLTIAYHDYRFESPSREITREQFPSRRFSRKIKKAPELTITARSALKEGNIRRALRLLKRVADDFPETPQAVEARKLLDGLPGAL